MDLQGKIFCKLCLSLLGFAVFLFIITIYEYGKWCLNFQVCMLNCLPEFGWSGAIFVLLIPSSVMENREGFQLFL